METYLNPSEEQIAKLQSLKIDGPILMLNLLKFKQEGGRSAYGEYASKAGPLLADAGAEVRYLGVTEATVIGNEDWDQVILVEYPSVKAFLKMWSSPDYPREVRSSTLDDSRLVCIQLIDR